MKHQQCIHVSVDASFYDYFNPAKYLKSMPMHYLKETGVFLIMRLAKRRRIQSYI